uniref:Peptidase domain containing associated with muscle regeneration 1a n=1 Tax=Acanthochromis polyacanthus TaxID=80966 RepID=A0A3Q1FFV5_9TELE
MCRPCCEYDLIQCRCPSKGTKVGYTVPCCRNAVNQCDPCIIHPGCSLFENCKTCHNGTWKANDDFFVNGKYCTECREGWSGGDCKTCGGVLQRAQGHIALESYPTNARCEWTLRVERGSSIQLRFSLLSLESDHNCHYDYVEVRDGDDLNSPVIGRFCGDRPPPPIKSSGNVLHILFASDGYNNFDGFVLTFQEIAGIINVKATDKVHLQRCETDCSTNKNAACSLPEKPLNGYLLPVFGPKEELVLVNHRCRPPFILTGSEQRSCLPNGTWSGSVPSCVKGTFFPPYGSRSVLLGCIKTTHGIYLGPFFSPHAGQTSPLRCGPPPKLLHGYHRYRCASPLYRTSGASRRTCLKTGRWSGGHVTCSPGEINSFSPLNLSDTQWPWHAAVYIRSPPDHTESSFWVLACSGALVAQRRVLVAAQCVFSKDEQQLLHPQHVKVVVGVHRQTAGDRLKGLHQLRVSDISVHPDFPSSPDSDVAVLKLKDKVKISERVLPACLPQTQGGEVTAQEAYAVRWILTYGREHPSHSTAGSQTRQVELSDAAQCERRFAGGGSRSAAISDKTLCVVSKPSTSPGPCPAVIPGITVAPGGSGETWQLLALESLVHEKTSCGRQSHTVQIRIANFRDWIEENMK